MILYNSPSLSIIVVYNSTDFYMIYEFNSLCDAERKRHVSHTKFNYLRSVSMMYLSSVYTLPNKNSKFVLAFDLQMQNRVKKHPFSVFHSFFNQSLILYIKQIKSKLLSVHRD